MKLRSRARPNPNRKESRSLTYNLIFNQRIKGRSTSWLHFILLVSGRRIFLTVSFTVKGLRSLIALILGLEWITNQENPFFLCVANRRSLSVEFYSTWSLLIGILHKSAKKIVLIPGSETDTYRPPETEEDLSEQRIYLGKPILNILAKELVDDETVSKYAGILRQWIGIDRENIVNRYAGMYWIVGPMEYETNAPVPVPFQPVVVFMWNPRNLEKCKINFGRSAAAFRIVIRAALGEERESAPEVSPMIADLEQVLRSLNECLDPYTKDMLLNQIGLETE